jgi:hypothetical protein
VTTTVLGFAGVTTSVGRSHALNASTDNVATTTNKYLMMILPCVEQKLSALLRAVDSLFRRFAVEVLVIEFNASVENRHS